MDLMVVSTLQVNHRPPGMDALIERLQRLIREGSIILTAAYLGASAAGNRGWEFSDEYIREMENFIRNPKENVDLLVSYPEARKNALQIVKENEKDGTY